ncbi:DHA2 family efflux MFS transporter permease subunit [Streptomyces barringtoniae]|uniref:DHA2 family efflux MFS transporter permease subunit n=1 Tax=Streptomyces barringtoniae TaxID=2892029 RepID=UPI001E3AFFFA|nr:DHA2 family efflux MFS transporter permease subunit [Streptomyces barringtoniae]MCC5480553.1 DHA2 family efflux MFS transporter permease subunit [Streptomyces barringtoniae]
MTVTATSRRSPDVGTADSGRHATATLVAAVLGFFVITLDATIVNVALPSIRDALGGGITGLQWVVDGYTLMFAALLLSAGALSDRIGARKAFAGGVALFVLASLACGLAPSLPVLIAARVVQGIGAAVTMPTSMALVRHAFPDPARRARAVGVWAMGGAVAAAAGPVLGGVLSLASWRMIFFINLPVGLLTLALLARSPQSPTRPAPFDWIGQITGILAMGGLTFGAIEAGEAGFTAPKVLISLGIAVAALAAFVPAQAKVAHPMVPLSLFRVPTVVIATGIGFAFMVGFYGLPFVFSLDFQQQHGLSALGAGIAFLPMMLLSACLTPFSARIAERTGPRVPVIAGLVLIAAGSIALAVLPASAPVGASALLLIPVGLAGPLVMPPTTAVLLEHVPAEQTGTASGVFNTSRQIGGALAVAVFGALISGTAGFQHGLRISLTLAAVIALAAALAATRMAAAWHRA